MKNIHKFAFIETSCTTKYYEYVFKIILQNLVQSQKSPNVFAIEGCQPDPSRAELDEDSEYGVKILI